MYPGKYFVHDAIIASDSSEALISVFGLAVE
jgi:hypothetical protein